jgi:AraC-like DNA-binding protein
MAKRDCVAQQIVSYVTQNWKRGVTVKEVAGTFGIDPSDVDRLFRKVTGKTIARYVLEKRKDYVVFMVCTKDCYAYELAQEFGYREEHSFTRWVKSTFGVGWTELCRLHRDSPHPPRLHATAFLLRDRKNLQLEGNPKVIPKIDTQN